MKTAEDEGHWRQRFYYKITRENIAFLYRLSLWRLSWAAQIPETFGTLYIIRLVVRVYHLASLSSQWLPASKFQCRVFFRFGLSPAGRNRMKWFGFLVVFITRPGMPKPGIADRRVTCLPPFRGRTR